jgi:hypothetical protein
MMVSQKTVGAHRTIPFLTIRASRVVSRRLDPFQCQIVLGITTLEDLIELFIEIGWSVLGLKQFPNPTDADIDANITNICRCGTYERLRRAIHRAANMIKS